MSPAQHFVQQVAELPADQRVAGQWQVQGVGPEAGRAALLVGSHDDGCTAVKETSLTCDGTIWILNRAKQSRILVSYLTF